MIYLALVRRCVCELCQTEWDLKAGAEPPRRCPNCHGVKWQWGKEDFKTLLARHGIKKLAKIVNPGATSRKRQEHGKKQFRRFRSFEECLALGWTKQTKNPKLIDENK